MKKLFLLVETNDGVHGDGNNRHDHDVITVDAIFVISSSCISGHNGRHSTLSAMLSATGQDWPGR